MFETALSCSDVSTNLFWGVFDFSIAPVLLYYAYIPISVITLALTLFVLYKERTPRTFTLVSLGLIFSLFLINEIIQWIAAPVPLVLLGWEFVPLFRVLIPATTFYFVYVFFSGSYPKTAIQALAITPVVITTLFISTSLNIKYFDLENCEGIPGALWNFVHIAIIGYILSILILTIKKLATETVKSDKIKQGTVGFSAIVFLCIFFGTSYWGDVTNVYDVALSAPLGMLIFISTLSYLIIRFKMFKVTLAAPIALILALWAAVFSLLFVQDITTARTIVSMTLIGLIGFSIALIRSIRREQTQRREIEQLAQSLARANTRLEQLDKQKSEFVSIASHQLRSPLTSIAGYASLLREGNYGVVPNKMLEPLDRIEQSARFMAESIEDYLNVSRIESGNMKYHLSDFNLRETTERICDDVRPEALRKGLVLLFRTNMTETGIVNADQGKIQQILHNLINNALKYTPKGSINVVVRDEPRRKRIFVDIVDTGIGMDDRTLHSIFQKFERGDKANTVNVKGTGLGLYVALRMAQAMGGTVTAHSDGESKGSRFTLELPLVM